MMKATVICDGRGNAGTGARAAVLYIGEGLQRDRYERAEKIEATTNIVAEHLSIQLGMELAKDYGVTDLLILNDSQTPVNHVLGTYDVTKDHLKPIVRKTWEMGLEFSSVEIRWVRRDQTKEADLLCRRVDRNSSGRSRPGGKLQPPEPRENPFRQKPFRVKRKASRRVGRGRKGMMG